MQKIRQFTKRAGLLAALLVAAGTLAPQAFTQSNVVRVSGTISSDTTWTANNVYVLQGAVFVDNAALRIEAGTRIIGESASNGTLVIARSGQIFAEGRADAPIVMTSDQPVGSRARADWGGLIINGDAPLNVPGGEAFGEGDTGVYGGTNPDDSSGVLRYVRVEYAGTEFSPDNELNGIAFQGVGRGTIVEFVQVHFNKDDGLEFFGGTVDVKYAVCTGIGDDSFDWTEGWQGRGQFWIGQQYGDDADQGIEADNNAENNDLEPRANPRLYNLTLIGDPDFDLGSESDIGILLREGTAATIKNSIVMGFKETGLDINDPATFTVAADGGIVLESMIFFRNNPNFSEDGDDDPAPPFTTRSFAERSPNVVVMDPLLRGPFDQVSPDYRPAPDSPATDGTVPFVLPPNDGFFE
ncbi:MAG TPA: hypothetical protein VEK15_26920, partial [Vicinamibacteria bacterium]|nr:hypothetical protein [Vicinamibacteria bacterium]